VNEQSGCRRHFSNRNETRQGDTTDWAHWQVRSLIDRGDVELLLTRFKPEPVPIHAVWPATKVLPAKTQLFVE
jgi:hypothetical protein